MHQKEKRKRLANARAANADNRLTSTLTALLNQARDVQLLLAHKERHDFAFIREYGKRTGHHELQHHVVVQVGRRACHECR